MINELDEKTALILIDLQKGITGMPVAHPIAGIIENSVKLTEAFRAAGLPVVLVNVDPIGAKWTQSRIQNPSAPKGEDAIRQTREKMEKAGFFELIPELNKAGTDILITKSTWNAFYGTSLHLQLQTLGITGIVLAGVATSIGVEGTARAASEHGYNISFAVDAMTDMDLAAHENSLRVIFPRMGELGDTRSILDKVPSAR